jgi:hypothetical protein
LGGNRVDRLLAGGVAGYGRIRRICGTIASATTVVFLAVATLTAGALSAGALSAGALSAGALSAGVLTAGALAAEAPNSRLSDDIALTKAVVSSLAAKDTAAVRGQLDPAMGQVADDKLLQMSDLIGASEPTSIETIWSAEGHNLQTGDGNSRILLEYALAGKWVVVDAVVKTEGSSKRFARLFLTSNTLPLRELNAFHLFGKGPVQYLFLAGWIATILLTGWAIIAAFKWHTGWRRWALIVLMPLGLTPTLAVNWNTAHVWVLEAVSNSAGQVIPFFALRYPMALFGYTETLVPYLTLSAPLIAFGYLIWQRRWSQKMTADDVAGGSNGASRPDDKLHDMRGQ